ncbi:ATP-binding protein [Fibrella aquatilis]|uniref:histidine kinase n=1 Tax=Fibrella aquatilis TaxID=2817059 RepID=A0A939GAX8_9BACT|nr:ATP-binding protein [Fibrella aquatilis]MBO0933018.1 response regulator [Fibrella aquatilis]
MKRLLALLLLLLVAFSGVWARPKPLRLTLDSLQRDFTGYALAPQPWQFRAGDDPRWASPTTDDRDWLPYRTGFSRDEAPPGWKGIGWFRLHVTIDSLPADSLLSLRLDHLGASEVFLDGQKIGGFGKIGSSSATGIDHYPNYEPITFRLSRAGSHLLAVRMATRRPYVSRWAQYPQGFLSWLAPTRHMTTYVVQMTRIWGINVALVFVPGLFGLLHLFLFLFYPARRSNLYYSLWLATHVIGSVCVYCDRQATSPLAIQYFAYCFWLSNIGTALASVVFIYSIRSPKAPRQLRIFYALALLLVGIVLLVRWINPVPVVFGFILLCLLEVIRVVGWAMLRRQPGVWLIGLGLLAVGVAIFIGASDVLGIWSTNPLGQNLFLTFFFLTLPLCTSLYLAQDFAQTSRNLEHQLRQVEELSAQTREQEAEKLRIVAGQNEQLEQTVLERTDQLQRQADQLREMDRVKSRFFTNLTHEFRTPLTLMLGPAEQILTQTQEPGTRKQAGLLHRNAERLLRLINQLLDLSKLEAGKLALTTAPGDLVALVRGTFGSFDSLAQQRGITLRFETGPECLMIDLDRDKLEKILTNLFSNALKFTSAGGTVSVGLSLPEADWVELTVQDTGVGIPTAKLPYVYDRFYQVDASDTREQEGTGIGLALTKELVDLHGGTIHISSEEGVGTTVMVRLPTTAVETGPQQNTLPDPTGLSAERQDFASLPNLVEAAAKASAEDPLILLVEDNDDVRLFIRSSLDNHYHVIEAADGEEGVRLARQHVPDLVITDLMMPKLNGYEVCATLKADERTSHIPVLMLTAKADLDSKLEGLKTGADSYLAKPFNGRELLAQLASLIQNRRQLRDYYTRTGNGLWPTEATTLPSMEQVFLNRVRAAIETHLADEQYSLDRLSDDVGMSRTQLHRKLKALTNQSPGDLLRLARLQHAHDLLRANVGTVAEVAYQVGFGNPANFATSFSRHFGYAPSEVKKRIAT